MYDSLVGMQATPGVAVLNCPASRIVELDHASVIILFTLNSIDSNER
jgi:hypothetical protein